MSQKVYVQTVEWIAIFALAVMVAVTFASTAVRFLVPGMGGIYWAEEVTRYLCIWMVFLASGLGVRYGVHLHVDLLTAKLPAPVQRTLTILSCLLMMVFEVVLLYWGGVVALSNMDQQSSSLTMPMGVAYAAIPVGGALMLFETIRVLLNTIRKAVLAHEPGAPQMARQVD